MNGFTMLWSKMLFSSIWTNESKETKLVWVTMMMMKDFKGIVQSSVVGLAGITGVTPDECKTALEIFMSPDKDDSSGVDEGRRIRKVSGGWQFINHDLYRFSTEAKREMWRQSQAEYRERKAKEDTKPATKKDLKRRATEADKARKEAYMAEDAKGVRT